MYKGLFKVPVFDFSHVWSEIGGFFQVQILQFCTISKARMKAATKSVHDLQDKTITGIQILFSYSIHFLGLFAATLYFGGGQDLWYQALARFELIFNELEDCLDWLGLKFIEKV